MAIALPTLSTKGWVLANEHPLVVANHIFAHFFCSDYSQTQLYLDKVSSFAWVMQSAQGDTGLAKSNLKTTLEGYFKRYFDNATVETSELPMDLTGRVSLSLYVEFVADGVTYTLSKAINLSDGVVQSIINLNNYGIEP